MSDAKNDDAVPTTKKKGGFLKLLMMAVILLVVLGGAAFGALYFTGSPLLASGQVTAEPEGPRLVPKAEQKRAAAGEGAEGSAASHGATGKGGEKYASNYYALDKEFTSNLRDSVHFVQVGIAISTPYDDSVIENIKTNEIAVRSALLMALGDATEEQVFSSEGKVALQRHLAKAINDTLKEKEGFGGVGNVYFTNFVVQ